jgi:hypothetical protein
MPGEDHGCTLAERSQADPRALVTLAGGTLTVTDDAGQVLAVTTDPGEAVTALLDALRPARCGVCGEPERHASHRVGGSAGTPRHAWRPASQRGIEGPVNRDGTL